MNGLDFEVKRSKVKVTTRPTAVKNHLFKSASFRRRNEGRRFVVEYYPVLARITVLIR